MEKQPINYLVEGFDKFTFRCHYLGYLMSKAKCKSNLEKYNELNDKITEGNAKYQGMKPELKSAKNLLDKIYDWGEERDALESVKHKPHLSQGCKTKLAEIYTIATTGRTKDIKNKYFEKGLHMEEDAITEYSLLVGKMYRKNKVRYNNGLIEGEIDFEDDDTIMDTKVCWDCFSFDAKAAMPLDPIYYAQGQGYMWLRNKKNFKLIYTLLDTPEHLLAIEKKKLMYEFIGTEEDYKVACEEIDRLHKYPDLPRERKIRVYEVFRNEEFLDKLESMVPVWRDYLNNFGKTFETQTETED